MQVVLLLISSLLLLSIAYQDLRTRQVSVLLFVGLWLLVCLVRWRSGNTINRILMDLGLNSLLLLALLITTLLYFRIKKKEKAFFDHLLGWGDIALWFALTPCFSLPVYITLLVTSLIFSLIVYLVRPMLSYDKNGELSIPLAGYQSLFFIPLFIVHCFLPLSFIWEQQNLMTLWTIK